MSSSQDPVNLPAKNSRVRAKKLVLGLQDEICAGLESIDEEGKLKQNSINPKATDYWVKSFGMTDVIVGDAILIKKNALTDLW